MRSIFSCCFLLVAFVFKAQNLSISLFKEDVSCHGEKDGFLSVTVSGGQAPYSILWSTGQTGTAIAALAPDNYSVLVSDAEGNAVSDSAIITQPNPMQLFFIPEIDTLTCIDTIVAPEIIGISSSGDTIVAPSPHISFGTFTDPETGCKLTGSMTIINDTDAPHISAQGGSQNCYTDSVQLFVEISGSYSAIEWTNGSMVFSNEQNPFVTAPGTYFVKVTGENGCTAHTSVFVTGVSSSPIITILNWIELSCFNPNELASFQNDVAFCISPSSDTLLPPITVNTIGLYRFFFLDDLTGCYSIIEGLAVWDNYVIPLFFDNIDLTAPGQLSVRPLDGTPPFTYSWLKDGSFYSSDSLISNLEAGMYAIMVTDSNGCLGQTVLEVSASSSVDEMDSNRYSVFPTFSTDFITIASAENYGEMVSIEIINMQGKGMARQAEILPPFQIQVEHLPKGQYILSVKNVEGKRTHLRFFK